MFLTGDISDYNELCKNATGPKYKYKEISAKNFF